jgi:hypothetical protein
MSEVTVSYVLQTVIPDTEPVLWKDEMSLHSFKDAAYRATALAMYRKGEGQDAMQARMVRVTVTEEVLDE